MERRSHFDMATSNLRPRNPTISLNVAMELWSHRNDLTILAYNTDCLYISSKKRIEEKVRDLLTGTLYTKALQSKTDIVSLMPK